MPAHTTFGELIAAQRRVLGWTQADLALAVGVDRTHISRLESNSKGVSVGVLVALAKVLDLDLERLTRLAAA